MTRQIRRLGIAFLVLYAILFLKLNQVQVFQAEALTDRPENTRVLQRDFNEPRGDIVSADGAVLATSEERRAALRYQRVYPDGELFAHITGFYSFSLGADGVERQYNDDLAGRTPALELNQLGAFLTAESSEGDVLLTVRKDVQTVARDALAGQEGSVVALDPRDGSILAMYSNPTFDPNVVSDNNTERASDAKVLFDAAEGAPLLAHAYRERYFPGSTFKVVTATAGLSDGSVTPQTPDYPVVTEYTPPLTTKSISNFGGSSCGGTLFAILAQSCNSSFSQMGVEQVGADDMVESAEAFGFNAKPPIDLPNPAESAFPTDFGAVVSRPEGVAPVNEDAPRLAQSSIGQNDVAATPLQMALVAAGVANGGEIMTPHVLKSVRARDGEVVRTYEPSAWRRAAEPSVAATMREAMVGVVTDGTATGMQITGQEVGAKTGTAQLGTEPATSHAWMIAFAGPPGEPPRVAVAVVVTNVSGASNQTGGRVAGPVARAVAEAALGVSE
ncbi:MAG: penicillin-binding protein 2 [Microthrixaceae bacterium]|nr:penicillin-binding protein 2 [Microthrixaceae bacterium]MCO5322659.1 penicillin-binding protein 2 [Microthrixaceae bacterium]